MARAAPAALRGHRHRGHPRPLLPRQRGRLDPRARPRRTASRGRATTPRGSSRSRSGCGVEEKTESERQKTLQRELEWIRMAPKARHAKGKARINAYEQLLAARPEEVARDLEIYIPPGPAPGRRRDRGEGAGQGLRRHAAHGGRRVRAAAGRHRRRHRPQRRGQDHAVPDDRRRGEARRRHAAPRRDRAARLRRPGAHPRPREDRLRGDLRGARRRPARQGRR